MLKRLNESCETSVFGTSSRSREEIKNSNVNNFQGNCFTFQSNHFKDLHKPRLLANFHDNQTSPVKVAPK